MGIELRPITPDEIPAFVHACLAAFGEQPDRERLGLEWSSAELDRTLAAIDDGDIVGTGRLYSLELTLPGLAVVPAAGVSWIGVLPTHRRRGILTSIMRHHLDDAVERGEALAVLYASEGTIYRRFGYGIATFAMSAKLDHRHTAFLRPVPEGWRVRLVDDDAAHKLLPEIFDRARRQWPGAVSRPDYWWGDQFFYVDKKKQEGAGFFAVCEGLDGAVEGYAAYRVKSDWAEGVTRNRLEVEDLVSVTPAARAVLWRYVCDVDLTDTITVDGCPVDEPLRWLLTESRRFHVTQLSDQLWVRLLDVPAALSARRYGAPGRVVLEVRDPVRAGGEAEGRFAVEADADQADVGRTTSAPDLTLDVAELGAAYLGGVSLTSLAEAGLAEEHVPGALARADAMFRTEPAPFAMTWF